MFDHCLYSNTTSLSRLLERQWATAFLPFGLSPPQAFLLRIVLARPGALQGELADTLTVARPTATRLLDGLQGKNLVERRQSERDGRECEIHPTRQAQALSAALERASAEVTKKLKKRLGPDAFATAVKHLRDVRNSLS